MRNLPHSELGSHGEGGDVRELGVGSWEKGRKASLKPQRGSQPLAVC